MDEKINLANSPQLGRIEKMVQEMCPDGVKWVKLGEIATLVRGKVISKTDIRDNEGPYPVYSSQTANDGVLGCINTFMYDGEYLTWTTDGAYAGTIFKRSGKFNITNVCGLINLSSADISLGYLYYWLSVEAPKYVYSGMGNPKLMSNVMGTVDIPLPPLPIQEAIADILDKFDRLSAELQAELQARKQQYEYYRDQLLAPSNSPRRGESEWKEYTLGELFVFKNGLNASKEQFGHGTPIVNYVNVYKKCSISFSDLDGKVELDATSIDRFRVQKGDVFFTRTSETREEVGIASVLLEDIKDCVFSGFVLRARPISDKILPEYCKYCFSTFDVRKQIIASSTLTTRALTNGTVLSKVIIPLPPLSEQARIVAILDKFEALVNDLSQGLPAEIAAVKEQYEYYRNKLLTFS